jgi:hypothetical protein
MATDKTYSVAGVSSHNGEYKVRFANDIMRIKILAKNGHEDIRLAQFDEPLTKIQAVLEISKMDEFQDVVAKSAIHDYLAENSPVTKKAKVTVEESEDVPF